jgi:hypothetical protein
MAKKQLLLHVLTCCAVLLTLNTGLAQSKEKPAGPLSPETIEKIHASEDTLALLAYAVVNDSIEHERFAACKVLITNLVRTLKAENSFNYKFERLRSVSIMAPPDSSFRIFTWQLYVNDSTYKYYGAIQMNQRTLKLFPLIDRSAEMLHAPTDETLSPDRWYGAVYYNLRQFDTREGRKYLLLGFDAFEFFNKRKVAEVLSFDKSGKPVFGGNVFYKDKNDRPEPLQRLFLEYNAEASVRFNYDEQYGMILYDHLIEMASPFGRGITYVPDGSYDGLKLEKGGKWRMISKVFNDVMEEAPRPEPILDTRKDKDIVGRKAKKRTAN